MPRYVILHHRMPPEAERPSHWDLMLEFGESLRTWALETEPAAGMEIAARALPDHRLAYLDYEGPVSGNRGEVARWDAGEFELVRSETNVFVANLAGQLAPRRLTLHRSPEGADAWTALFEASAAKRAPDSA